MTSQMYYGQPPINTNMVSGHYPEPQAMVLAQYPTAGLVQVPASQFPPQPQPNPIQPVSYAGMENTGEYPGRRRPRRAAQTHRNRERLGDAAKSFLPAAIGIAASEVLAMGQNRYNTRKHGQGKDCDPMLKAVIEGAVATAGGLALAHHEKKKMQERDRGDRGDEGGEYWESGSENGEESERDSRLRKLVEGGLATAAAVMTAHYELKKSQEKKARSGGHTRRHRRTPY